MSASQRFELTWHVALRFYGADHDTWYRRANGARKLLALLRATSLWPRFDVFAQGFVPGAPIASLDGIRDLMATTKDVYTFANGAPRNAMFLDEAELAARVTIRADELVLQIVAAGRMLDRIGVAFFDDVEKVLSEYFGLWRERVCLVRAVVVPRGLGAYPRPRPPRESPRFVASVVDVVSTVAPMEASSTFALEEARVIAAAAIPGRARRRTRGDLAIVRWVEDPRDRDEVRIAAGLHEAWLAELLPTTVAFGWNEEGDRSVSVVLPKARPPFALYDAEGDIGYLEVAAAGPTEEQANLSRKPPADLREIRWIAPSRERAIELRAVAASLGVLVVVHRVGGGLWDPCPSGQWLER